MNKLRRFTVHRSPFTMPYPFPVTRVEGLIDQVQGRANGEWKMVNGFTGGKAC